MNNTPEQIMASFTELLNSYLHAYFMHREISGPEEAQATFKESADQFMVENAGLVDMDDENDRQIAILAAVYMLAGVIICSGACEKPNDHI